MAESPTATTESKEEVSVSVPDTRSSKNSSGSGTKKSKKTLRDLFLSADDDVDEEDEADRDTKLKRAKEELVKSGCSHLHEDGTFQFKGLRTSLHELGQYGVGVQLYFEFLFGFGVVFAIQTLVSLPSIYYMASGSLVEDRMETRGYSYFYMKFFATFSAGNLGACPPSSDPASCMTTEQIMNRQVFTDSDELLRDHTSILGIFDLLQVLIFLSFVLWFKYYHVPKVERVQDEAHVTASDFTIEVDSLPRRLPTDEEHKQYDTLLKNHFIKVLKEAGVPEEECIIPEVSLIREYDGCISKFMEQGNLLEMMNEHKVQLRKAKKENNESGIEKHKKKVDHYRNKIVALEDSMAKQGEMTDEQREVCGAFVMFETEQLKQKVLSKYLPSASSYVARLGQSPHLRFHTNRLIVKQACEPADLYWENLDYSYVLHKLRKAVTLSVSISLLLFSIFLLNFLRSTGGATDTSSRPYDMWVFSSDRGDPLNPSTKQECLELCELKLSTEAACVGSLRDDIEEVLTSLHPRTTVDIDATGLFDGDTTCTSPSFRSTSCTPGLSILAIKLRKPEQVKCVNIEDYRGSGAPGGQKKEPKALTVHGCNSESLSQENFSLDIHCVKFDTISMESFEENKATKMRSDCLWPISLQAAQQALIDGEDPIDGPRVKCFCEQEAGRNSMLQIPGYSSDPEYQVCYDWAYDTASGMLTKYIGVGAVLCLNNVLLFVFTYLDALGRYRTATSLASSQMYNLFISELVNTAVVYLMVGINTHGWGEGTILEALNFGGGPYDDLSSEWFVTVGSDLFFTIVFQVVFTMVFPAAWARVVDPLMRWFFARGVESQELLDEIHQLPHWLLSLRVAETMVAIFCCFIYSGGFPLLYPVGAMYCLFAYWADKYSLLRGSRKPPGFSKSAITGAVWLAPIAALFHCVFSLWVLGNQLLVPSDWSGLRDFSGGLLGMTAEAYKTITDISLNSGSDVKQEYYDEYLKSRAMDMVRSCPLPLFLIFVFLLARWVIGFIFQVFRPCLGGLEDALGKKGEDLLKAAGIQKESKDTTETYSQAKARNDAEGRHQIMSYQLWNNPNYEEAVEALKFNPSEEERSKMGMTKSGGSSIFDIGDKMARLEGSMEGSISSITNTTGNIVEAAVQSGVARMDEALGRTDDPKDNENVISTQGPEAVTRVEV